MTEHLQQEFDRQRFPNGYELVSGVVKHAEYGDRFQIPPNVIKKHVRAGHFVELRIDSSRFSAHEDAPEECIFPNCNEEATKPILRHEQPATLLPLPQQNVPSRGWGEDFWVQITERDGEYFKGVVDNPVYEARLHDLHQMDVLVFHEDHILAVHDIHRRELVLGMNSADLQALTQWLGSQRE